MIRHGLARTSSPVFPLAFAMIQSRFRAVPVPAIGAAMLSESGLFAASRAAIALPAIATGTDQELAVAFTAPANATPESDFAMPRHASPQAGLDNGNGFVAL
jgi:hypothetical protein